jgi:hypothetical protein
MLPLKSNYSCYYIGAGKDLINPIIHTECQLLVCIDLIDKLFYPAIEMVPRLSPDLKTNIHLISVIDNFCSIWKKLQENELDNLGKLNVNVTEIWKYIRTYHGYNSKYNPNPDSNFTPDDILQAPDSMKKIDHGIISSVVVEENRFEIKFTYKNIPRTIIYYSGVSDDVFDPPELKNVDLDVMYLSAAAPFNDLTYTKYNPRYIVCLAKMYKIVEYLKQLDFIYVEGNKLSYHNDKINLYDCGFSICDFRK